MRRLPVFGSSRGASPSGSHTALPGAWNAANQVEPATASLHAAEGGIVPILPKWRDDTAPRLPFPIGVGGSSVRVVGVTMSIWS